MTELLNLRQENAKTYDLGNGKHSLLASIGAVHYKDNYADPAETWKDIDLTWAGNQILTAPYELTREGCRLTIRNKRTGEVSTIELTGVGGKPIKIPPDIAWEKSQGLARAPGIVNLDNIALDTDLEIVAENGRVKFTRVLKSDKAPVDAKFTVTGNWAVKAQDADGELPVETSLVAGVLTETLKPDRIVKYPVRIDPTWQVAANSDDCYRSYSWAVWNTTWVFLNAGCYTAAESNDYGSATRFLNVTIPAGSTIILANLRLTAGSDRAETIVNTRLRAQANVNPATFSTAADFDGRTWTAAFVNWDAIAAWTGATEYTSPDIKTTIQEVIGLPGWASGNPIVVLWDDFQRRSDQENNHYRQALSYDASHAEAPKLYVEYTVPAGRSGNMASKMVAAGVI